MNQRYCILDYETRSEADLRRCGAFEYANHPTTKLMCASWRIGTKQELRKQLSNKEPAKLWSPYLPNEADAITPLFNECQNPGTLLVAHNALFEQVITRFVFWKDWKTLGLRNLPHERWICTASMAAALALPRKLADACAALNLPVQKDMEGHRLMMKMSKPRKTTKISDLKRLMKYCQTDVDAETWLFLTLPELSPQERKIWLLDQKINFRGFTVDRDLVKSILGMIKIETENLNRETKQLTDGQVESTTQRDATLEWLQNQMGGSSIEDLQAKTVEDALKEEKVCFPAGRRILEIRQSIAKTSTAKYSAFEQRSRSSGKLRDHLLYHGASTGRWSGMGIQPQNFPRGSIGDAVQAAEICKEGDLELIRLLYGNPMNVFSSCLRPVITASEGKELFCADYGAIEARVLFWIADHAEGISAFASNRPLYEEMAQQIYNIDHLGGVTKPQREVGKRAVLGCGYGMGAAKFRKTCSDFGIEISEALAKMAVQAYRTTHHPVPILWSNLERAAIAAVKKRGTIFMINKVSWRMDLETKFLWCRLPSGRKLAYYAPEIGYEKTPWGELRAKLYHYEVNSRTRKWQLEGTYGGKLTENVVSGIARDLMAEAMLRVEERGYEVLITVHDEILAEREVSRPPITEEGFISRMAESPTWAKDLPIKVAGWKGSRYHK